MQGAGIIPKVVDLNIIDEVVPTHSDAAEKMATELWMNGIPVGASAGAIIDSGVRVCARPESAGKLVVAIIPSFGERYFSHVRYYLLLLLLG